MNEIEGADDGFSDGKIKGLKVLFAGMPNDQLIHLGGDSGDINVEAAAKETILDRFKFLTNDDLAQYRGQLVMLYSDPLRMKTQYVLAHGTHDELMELERQPDEIQRLAEQLGATHFSMMRCIIQFVPVLDS